DLVAPSTMMMSTASMLVLVAIAMAITAGDVMTFGVGLWSLVLCALSIGGFWLSASYGRRAPWTLADGGQPGTDAGADGGPSASLRALTARSAIAGAVIFAAGYALSQTGDALAEQTGIGTGMVGFALIGVSTSMPELSSIIAALRIRRYEMAFGQVLGTNFFNLSLILLADAVFAGGPVVNELGAF